MKADLFRGTMTKKQAILGIKRMSFIYPNRYKYRIKRSKKGMFGISMLLGFAVLLICLAIANNINSIFSLGTDGNDLLQSGFIVLGIFGLLAGVIKSV